jgi:hypothetical protein
VFFVADMLDVEVPANALFLCIIFLLLLMVFALTVAVSRQACRIKKLIQELGLLKAELESHSHCHPEQSHSHCHSERIPPHCHSERSEES